jgi:hypothetical protein
LLVQDLQRLHDGILARYGLRPLELVAGKVAQEALLIWELLAQFIQGRSQIQVQH